MVQAIGKVTSRLENRKIVLRYPVKARVSPQLKHAQPLSETRPVSYSTGTGNSLTGRKMAAA